MTKSTTSTGKKTCVQVFIHHQNHGISRQLEAKITNFLTETLNIEKKCINFLFFEIQSEEELSHIDVTVKVEIYNIQDIDEAFAQKMYGHIALEHFRLTLIIEKKDGIIVKNY